MYLDSDLHSLWKELETAPVQLSRSELESEMRKLRSSVRRRNWIEGSAATLVCVAWIAYFFIFPDMWMRVGSVLTVVGGAAILLQMRAHRTRIVPEFAMLSSVEHYRDELIRQHKFYTWQAILSRTVAITPGPLVFCFGFERAFPSLRSTINIDMVLILILLAGSIPMNVRMARKLSSRLASLARFEGGGLG